MPVAAACGHSVKQLWPCSTAEGLRDEVWALDARPGSILAPCVTLGKPLSFAVSVCKSVRWAGSGTVLLVIGRIQCV